MFFGNFLCFFYKIICCDGDFVNMIYFFLDVVVSVEIELIDEFIDLVYNKFSLINNMGRKVEKFLG